MEYNSCRALLTFRPFFTDYNTYLLWQFFFVCWEKLQLWEMLQQLFWCLVSCLFAVFIVRLFCDAISLGFQSFNFGVLVKGKVSNVPMELKIYPFDFRCGTNHSIFSFKESLVEI